MATTASDENFYRRRLDRTPEKLEFHALPDQDKKLISSLREAVTGAHSKMSRMKDEVEDKWALFMNFTFQWSVQVLSK